MEGLLVFLLRPSAFLIGQLPFGTVICRGTNLKGVDGLLIPFAQKSFNIMMVGVIIGAVGVALIGYFIKMNK